MNQTSQSKQLVLFPGEQVAWETLTDECRQSVCQLFSLLIERVRNQQHQQPQTNTSVEENHV